MRIAAIGKTMAVGFEEDAGPTSVDPGIAAVRFDIKLALSDTSRSSGTRPVSTSRAGLRRVWDGPSARMLSFCSRTCIPRSGTRRRAVALGGTS
jgi:hypothetical protein